MFHHSLLPPFPRTSETKRIVDRISLHRGDRGEPFRNVYTNPSTSIGGYRFRRLPAGIFPSAPDISAAKVKRESPAERKAFNPWKQRIVVVSHPRLLVLSTLQPFDFPLFPDRPFFPLVSSISITLLWRLYFRERTRGLHRDELREEEGGVVLIEGEQRQKRRYADVKRGKRKEKGRIRRGRKMKKREKRKGPAKRVVTAIIGGEATLYKDLSSSRSL